MRQHIVTFVTDTRYIHLSFDNPLLSLFELISCCFTDIAILTDVGRITTLQLTLQRLYTLLRHISHVALSPQHLSHPPNLRFHIYHHSLVRFVFSVQRIAEPLGLSHCSHFGHVAVTIVALPSVFGFCCCGLHWSGDCQRISAAFLYSI